MARILPLRGWQSGPGFVCGVAFVVSFSYSSMTPTIFSVPIRTASDSAKKKTIW